MSHWTKVSTKISDMGALKAALEQMGLEYQEGSFSITQYGTTEKAELKLDNAVGFSRQEDGTFAMVGDFYHSRNPKLKKYYSNNAKFQKEIQAAYAVEETVLRLEEQQFFVADRQEDKENIYLTFERY